MNRIYSDMSAAKAVARRLVIDVRGHVLLPPEILVRIEGPRTEVLPAVRTGKERQQIVTKLQELRQQGLTIKECAKIVGIPHGTAIKYLYHART